MSQSLTDIAKQLRDSNKKVQLIYGFNGAGKTRLSREFKELVAPKGETDDDESTGLSRKKILYYNAFTEDLFYWDNDLTLNAEPKLNIQPNSFTTWILHDQGQDQNIITNFQHYSNDKLTPHFNQAYTVKDELGKEHIVPAFSEVTFSIERGDNERLGNIKVSKGEESNFIWSIFYAVIEQVIEVLNVAEPNDRETDQFNQLEYIFIDDPVSSLDENNLIELAVDLTALIKSSKSDLKFIIATHNPLFFNVIFNELGKAKTCILNRSEGGTYALVEQENDSPFAYHLFLISELDKAIASGEIHKYHFNFLRNLFEKTATFLGHKKWASLLPKTDDGKPNPYEARIINISSHSKHAGEEVRELTEPEKQMVKYLTDYLTTTYGFWRQEAQHG